MKIDFKGLLEGAWNSVFAKASVEKVSTERLDICAVCEHKKKRTFPPFDEFCNLCGCNLAMKSRCLSCACPIDKWIAVASQAEDEEIEERLKQDNNGEN